MTIPSQTRNGLTSLLEERYKTGESSNITLNQPLPDALSTILQHRSIRSFLPNPLPSGTLETLIAAGQSASTTSMLQTWSVVAIQDRYHKLAAAKISGGQAFIRQAPLFLIFCPDLNRLTNLAAKYQQAGKPLENMDMLLVATIDAAIAGQNVAIAAEALGLGCCFVGGVRNCAKEMVELLRLPERTFGLFGMAIGYADPVQHEDIKPRLPMQEVLHYETWDGSQQDEHVGSFDKVLGRHYNKHLKIGRKAWSEFVARWKADGKLDGRENIRGLLEDQGFGLN
ncbi:Nitroreductase-like protein [Aspergillus aurantiobrunneus]